MIQRMETMKRWQDATNLKEKYGLYLASREWAAKKQEVRKRSGGTCEHCLHDTASQVHHVTYVRQFDEPLDDLMDVCEACHRFLSHKSDHDPKAYWKSLQPRPIHQPIKDGWIQCPDCRAVQDNVHIVSVRVLQAGTESQITRDETMKRPVRTKARPRNGAAIDVQFACECGKCFTWHMQFRNGCTMFDVQDTPDDLLRDDELWRD